MKSPIRFLSVCSGIEAASQALIPLGGFQCAAVSEIDPFACAVLAQRFGASRPAFMPDPADVTTHEPDGTPRKPAAIEKDRKNRANAIKAVNTLPAQGEIPNLGDMSRYQEWPDADFDALFGGTPCQSFSISGLRKGLDDPRGNLMLTYGAVAARYRPRWLLWENVPGVLSSNDGRDFGSLLALLSGRTVNVPEGGWQNSGIVPGIGDAYGLAWRVLDAQYVRTRSKRRAVPQRRRRVFLVGYLGDWRRAAAVLFDRESLRRDPAPSRRAGQRAAATITSSAGGCSGKDDPAGRVIAAEVSTTIDASYGRLQGTSGQDVNHGHSHLIAMSTGQANAEICQGHGPTLTCNHEAPIIAHQAVQEVAHTLRGRGFDATDDGSGKGTPIIPVPIAFNSREDPEVTGDRAGPLGASLPQAQAVAFAIQAGAVRQNPESGPDGVGVQEDHACTLEARPEVQMVAFAQNQREEVRVMDVSSSLAAEPGMKQQTYLATPWAVRRLMPVECERLQGMEDGITNIAWRKGTTAPDGPRYKTIGNSWPLNSIEWIGERMKEVDGWP